MNAIFLRLREGGLYHRAPCRALASAWLALFATLPCLLHAQNIASDVEFKSTVEQISQARLDGAPDNQIQEEKALVYLDSVAIGLLSSSAGVNLDAANSQLSRLVTRDPPVGENYHLTIIRAQPPTYALVANFGLGGPAAVRLYAPMAGRYALVAGIDSFSHKDFFDSDIELVAVSRDDGVFVIVSGRTDDLATGVFSAWRFDGQHLSSLWISDPLERSSYQMGPDGFQITYCSKPDDDHPGQCLDMARDVYRAEAGDWKRVENTTLGPAKTP